MGYSMSLIKSNLTPASPVKVLINIGGTMDIPTGFYVKGHRGNRVLLGGLGALTGMTGIGNSFKSTIMHYMMLAAGDRLCSTAETSMSTYDTEINIHESHLYELTKRFDSFKNTNILNDGTWVVTDKTVYLGDEWFEKLKEYLATKKDNAAKISYVTPFMDRDKTPMRIIIPTFSEVDSFSTFQTSDVAKIQDENELGSQGGNMVHMRQGLAKLRFLTEMPALAGSANHFTLLSAHLGKETAIAAGPFAPPPTKKLQHMKQGDKIKGVTDQFFFLTNNFWQTQSVAPLTVGDFSSRTVMYPSDKEDNAKGEVDLNVVSIKLLRGKSGPSGISLDLVISQKEGLLPTLTEYNFLKNQEDEWFVGNKQNFRLDIYPDVNLSRTTIRGKIDSDPKLCRAINITSELCQIKYCLKEYKHLMLTPKELYDKIKEKGYDWDFILSNTRGWWTVDDDKHPSLYPISTLDLLCMATDDPLEKYHPYWLEDDKKTIKPEFLKK
jgi:hypothetical protein